MTGLAVARVREPGRRTARRHGAKPSEKSIARDAQAAPRAEERFRGAPLAPPPLAGPPTPAAWPSPRQTKNGWGRLAPELKVQVALSLWADDVVALGNADVGLIPYLAAAPGLQVRQSAYRRAIAGTRGQALLAALRTYAPEYRADDRDWLPVDDDESAEVLAAVCALGEGRGPAPLVWVMQDNCAARMVGLPARVHVDVDASASLRRRRQPPWTVPPGVNCLHFHLANNLFGGRDDLRRSRVLGRHSFGLGHALHRVDLSHLDLTRGRLDLSAVASCNACEFWSLSVGSGNFGLRWPREVKHLRLVGCTFADQGAAFALPDGLQTLDVTETHLAQQAKDWTLPATLRVLDASHSTLGAGPLPLSLPAAIERISVSTEGPADELRGIVFPQTLKELSIGCGERPYPQPRKAKLFKRNWQRALRAQLPGVRVTVR